LREESGIFDNLSDDFFIGAGIHWMRGASALGNRERETTNYNWNEVFAVGAVITLISAIHGHWFVRKLDSFPPYDCRIEGSIRYFAHSNHKVYAHSGHLLAI
jgi:hypothetical protein